MPGGLICPQHPGITVFVHRSEAVVPGGFFMREEFSHKQRRIGKPDSREPDKKIENEVGILIKMNLIYNIFPALKLLMRGGKAGPDALNGNRVNGVNLTHGIIENGINIFVILV